MRATTSAIAVTTALATTLLLSGGAWAGDAAAGKVAFEANCSSCHGLTGKGDGPVGQLLTPPPRDFSVGDFKLDTDKDGETGTDADIRNVIKKGAAEFGGSPLMAPLPAISDGEVENIIAYIRTLLEG